MASSINVFIASGFGTPSPRRRGSSCNTDCATGAKLGGRRSSAFSSLAFGVNTWLTQLCAERRQAEAVHVWPRRNRQYSATNYCRSLPWSPDCVEDNVNRGETYRSNETACCARSSVGSARGRTGHVGNFQG